MEEKALIKIIHHCFDEFYARILLVYNFYITWNYIVFSWPCFNQLFPPNMRNFEDDFIRSTKWLKNSVWKLTLSSLLSSTKLLLTIWISSSFSFPLINGHMGGFWIKEFNFHIKFSELVSLRKTIPFCILLILCASMTSRQ